MSTFGLTRLQRDCLRVIQELTGDDAVPPSYEQIAHELGMASKSGVKFVVDRLVERGFLARKDGKRRSLAVITPVPMAEDVEFVGLFDDPDLAACLTGKRHVAP